MAFSSPVGPVRVPGVDLGQRSADDAGDKRRGCDETQGRGSVHRVAAGMIVLASTASAARELVPHRWKNCTIVNQRYPHGLGKRFAHDKTTGIPVTNFYRSTRLYLVAMSYNRGLDRDKDGIACEKH
jgi:Excalibur calcium-binding domain